MGRARKGSAYVSDGLLYARVTYTNEFGQRRDVKKRALTVNHAHQLCREMLSEIDQRGPSSLDTSRMTFEELTRHYLVRYVTPARYVGNRKVSGLRGHKEIRRIVLVLAGYFGAKKLRSITHGDILKFKTDRLDIPVAYKKAPSRQRAIATVNREMGVLRRMLWVALYEGWILKHPFKGSRTLISPSDEVKRIRVCSRDEEMRLLDACDERREKLRVIIICAIDTGMRRGEIFSLTWADVDLPNRRINIRALNTKTLHARSVPITVRLLAELEKLPQRDPAVRVFGIVDTVKRSWATAKAIAGIEDLRFHDLRHTYATRLVQGGLPLPEVARVLGHTSISTTFRYANIDDSTFDRALRILDGVVAVVTDASASYVN